MTNEQSGNKKPHLHKRKVPIIQWVAGVVAVGVCLFFGIKCMGTLSSKKIFTEYPPLTRDTLTYDAPPVQIRDSSLTKSDTISVASKDTSAQDSGNNKMAPSPQVPGQTVDLFKVNREYGKIDSPTTIGTENVAKGILDRRRLFEELLLPSNAEEAYVEAFQNYAKVPVASSKSILILLSVLGKQLLLGEQIDDVQHMLLGLTESDDVVEILIANREGAIVYATQPQHINMVIESLFPELALQTASLAWHQKGDHSIAAIPVFHRYGKIGVAVLVTKQTN